MQCSLRRAHTPGAESVVIDSDRSLIELKILREESL